MMILPPEMNWDSGMKLPSAPTMVWLSTEHAWFGRALTYSDADRVSDRDDNPGRAVPTNSMKSTSAAG
jgi:hypothetical protein